MTVLEKIVLQPLMTALQVTSIMVLELHVFQILLNVLTLSMMDPVKNVSPTLIHALKDSLMMEQEKIASTMLKNV